MCIWIHRHGRGKGIYVSQSDISCMSYYSHHKSLHPHYFSYLIVVTSKENLWAVK